MVRATLHGNAFERQLAGLAPRCMRTHFWANYYNYASTKTACKSTSDPGKGKGISKADYGLVRSRQSHTSFRLLPVPWAPAVVLRYCICRKLVALHCANVVLAVFGQVSALAVSYRMCPGLLLLPKTNIVLPWVMAFALSYWLCPELLPLLWAIALGHCSC